MNNLGYLYDDGIVAGIDNDMSFSTNVLEQYDNVVYHCALFAYNAEMQKQIDEDLSSQGRFTGTESGRVYIVKDGVTTKFSIRSFTMKNTFGNIGSDLNVATYSIKFKITEALSCLLTNELETLAYMTGYDGYLMRPYWFEVWFSGYKHDTLEPISRIPLPNGETSLLYEGFLSNVKSHLDSSGTEWSVDFTPSYDSLLTKSSNILSVPASIKSDAQMDLKTFLQACANSMYEKFLDQYGASKEEKDEIGKIVKAEDYIKITLKDEKGNVINEEIKSTQDSSNNQAKANSEHATTDKTILFTTITQDFLSNSEKEEYKSMIAKYDIKSELVDYYKNKPLYKHNIDIYLIKDEFMRYKLDENNNTKSSFSALDLFNKERASNALVKKYQFGFSGADTSVLEVFNNYDNLYFMNGLKQSSEESLKNNINYKNSPIPPTKSDEKKTVFQDATAEGYLEDIFKDIHNSITGDIAFQISCLNKIASMNNGITNKIKDESTISNTDKERKALSAKLMWENLYKSGQMSETKFEILGDPYWISSNAYRTGNNNSNDLKDALTMSSLKVPNYRCVFIIKSTPDQNSDYTVENPTDYTYYYSIHASGIYLMVDCESIFNEGKFTQKLKGVLDVRFIKEYGNGSS